MLHQLKFFNALSYCISMNMAHIQCQNLLNKLINLENKIIFFLIKEASDFWLDKMQFSKIIYIHLFS